MSKSKNDKEIQGTQKKLNATILKDYYMFSLGLKYEPPIVEEVEYVDVEWDGSLDVEY